MNTKTAGYLLILIVLLSGAFSCTRESRLPEPSSDKVLLELYALAETYHKPVSRTGMADETSITTPPWVFVAFGNDDDAIVYEIRQSFALGSKTYVSLYENDSPSRLLILANPPAVTRNIDGTQYPFDQTNLENQFLGRTLAYLVNNLITAPLLDSPQPTVPYTPGLPLPMSALLQLNAINDNTIINNQQGGALPLSRVVAKVVVNATAASDFTLLGATVTGAPRSGMLAQLNQSIRSNAGNLTDYISPSGDDVAGISAAVGNTTAVNPIYIYESAEESTSVIIKGIYDGVEGYYRLIFHTDGQRIDVRRNHSYTFMISAVTRVGYPTWTEAAANPPSNVIATLLVADLSTDIADNGEYYLGLSNSETIIYDDAIAQNNIRITTATTNAPVSVTERTITAVGTGISAVTTAINVNGSVTSTDVYVNLTPAFNSGTVELRLGNLLKTIFISRQFKLGFSTSITQFPTDYVAAEAAPGATWLTFSTSNNPATGSGTAHNNVGEANMYMFAETSLEASQRTATAYLSRANEQGRVLLYVTQAALGVLEPLEFGYVGTFHRWNQTGERVITIPYTTTGNTPTNGTWTATVIGGGDFIVLDTALPGRTKPLPGDAESFQVSGSALSVSGNATSAAAPIYFRVGLTNIISAPTSAPRYGLILLQYNNNTRMHQIWVRQGEAADYVMRSTDNPSGTTGLTIPRTLARKFSAFNITDPQKVVGAAPVDRGTRGYVFTDYPSQAGYYFQWYQTRAWDPATPSVTWDDPALTGFWDTAWESCPSGYRRPGDASTTLAYITDPVANNSEIRQSLYLNPQDGFTSSTDNSTWGYYADGFYDRQVIAANSAAGSGADIAYAGRLFFNPNNYASLFIPSTGYRFAGAGAGFFFAGEYSYNWSTTSYNTTSSWGVVSTGNASNLNSLGRGTSFTIRCIAE